MFRHSVASTFALFTSVVLSGLLLIAATPSPVHAAEIKLLGPASFRVLFPKLLPQFEESSGDTVTAGYAPLGVITERVIKGEAVDVAIVSGKQNEELQKQGKLLAGSRVEIAQVGFTVFVKKGAAKPDLSSADALKRALLAAKSIAVGDSARGGGASLYTISLLKRLGISEEVKVKSRLEPSGTEIADQLLSKHHVLSFKPQLRLEWRGQDDQNETEQSDHPVSLGDSVTSSTGIGFSIHTMVSEQTDPSIFGGSSQPLARSIRLQAGPAFKEMLLNSCSSHLSNSDLIRFIVLNDHEFQSFDPQWKRCAQIMYEYARS